MKKRSRRLTVAGVFLAVLLIVVEEATDVELFGEALLGVFCIALIASSVGSDSGGAIEARAHSAEAARRLSEPSF